MKTSMQELINDLKITKISAEESLNELENEYIRGIVSKFSQVVLDAVIEGIESEYLEKEKQQIEKSFYKGIQEQQSRELSEGLFFKTEPNQYYSKTFNNHE